MKKNEKKSHNLEKIERGTLWDFSTSVLSENSKKMKGGPFGFFWHCATFFRKFFNVSKGSPFVFFHILQLNVC